MALSFKSLHTLLKLGMLLLVISGSVILFATAYFMSWLSLNEGQNLNSYKGKTNKRLIFYVKLHVAIKNNIELITGMLFML